MRRSSKPAGLSCSSKCAQVKASEDECVRAGTRG